MNFLNSIEYFKSFQYCEYCMYKNKICSKCMRTISDLLLRNFGFVHSTNIQCLKDYKNLSTWHLCKDKIQQSKRIFGKMLPKSQKSSNVFIILFCLPAMQDMKYYNKVIICVKLLYEMFKFLAIILSCKVKPDKLIFLVKDECHQQYKIKM